MTEIRWKSEADRKAWHDDFVAYGNAISRTNSQGLTEHVPMTSVKVWDD